MTDLRQLDLDLARWLSEQPTEALLVTLHAVERECSARGHHRVAKLLDDATREFETTRFLREPESSPRHLPPDRPA